MCRTGAAPDPAPEHLIDGLALKRCRSAPTDRCATDRWVLARPPTPKRKNLIMIAPDRTPVPGRSPAPRHVTLDPPPARGPPAAPGIRPPPPPPGKLAGAPRGARSDEGATRPPRHERPGW